jgi:hypothetical protein
MADNNNQTINTSSILKISRYSNLERQKCVFKKSHFFKVLIKLEVYQ